MLTEGRVRAIAAQVASAIAAKIKPSVSEEQIRSDVEAVLRAMKEAGELEGGTVTDEQISAAVVKSRSVGSLPSVTSNTCEPGTCRAWNQ